jgi:hypothetical protein
MNTVGPAISLRTSCWLFPQKEQYNVFLESPEPDLLMNSKSYRFGRNSPAADIVTKRHLNCISSS